MPIEQQGQNDAQQDKGMKNDPKWTTQEREKYQAAYNAAEKKDKDKQ